MNETEVAALCILSLVTVGLLVYCYHMTQQIKGLQEETRELQEETRELRENSNFWSKVVVGIGAMMICGVAMRAAAAMPATSSYTYLPQVTHYLFNVLLAPDHRYYRLRRIYNYDLTPPPLV